MNHNPRDTAYNSDLDHQNVRNHTDPNQMGVDPRLTREHHNPSWPKSTTAEKNARNQRLEPPSASQEVNANEMPRNIRRDLLTLERQDSGSLNAEMERMSLAPSEPQMPAEPSVKFALGRPPSKSVVEQLLSYGEALREGTFQILPSGHVVKVSDD